MYSVEQIREAKKRLIDRLSIFTKEEYVKQADFAIEQLIGILEGEFKND